MHRIRLYAMIVAALTAVSCQSILHLSYMKPGEDAGRGLKYYKEYSSDQQTQPAESANQSDG